MISDELMLNLVDKSSETHRGMLPIQVDLTEHFMKGEPTIKNPEEHVNVI